MLWYSHDVRDAELNNLCHCCKKNIAIGNEKDHYLMHAHELPAIPSEVAMYKKGKWKMKVDNRKCPLCPSKPPAAAKRIAEHLARDHHSAAAFTCPSGCSRTGYARADSMLRHRASYCKKCQGCGATFESATARFTHETQKCPRISKTAEMEIIKTRRKNQQRVAAHKMHMVSGKSKKAKKAKTGRSSGRGKGAGKGKGKGAYKGNVRG